MYNFFLSISENLPDQTLLILTRKEKRYIAGAFSMHENSTLYGRHCDCNGLYQNLHLSYVIIKLLSIA